MFKPKFTITPEINNKIAKIEKFKTLFENAKILPELSVELRFRATVESVHSSTSIEGNPLSKQEVQDVIRGNPITATGYIIKEVLNYKSALSWINKEQKILSYDKILHLHQILMTNLLPSKKTGRLRPGPIYIINDVNNEEIIQYTGPEQKQLKKIIDSFIKWAEIQKQTSGLHPVLLAGIIHYIFISIHPFADGNGRTNRLLTHHFLKSSKYNFNNSLSLDSYYLQNREAYYQALNRGKTFDDRMFADITPFLEFFVEGFLQSVRNITQYVQLGKILTDKQQPITLNQEELQILDYAYQFNSITIDEAVKITNIPRRTMQRRLSNLVDKKILKIKGKGPSTTYQLLKS